jgi:predicted RNA-binding protein with PUA-like domain
MAAKRYWLMKSEPGVYSIDDLERDGSTSWEGVRNYQARNFMRDDVKVGDLVLFYHSNAAPPGVAGIARVSKAAYPDPTQFDRRSKYFDETSSPDDPRWLLVDVEFVEKFPEAVPLDVLKSEPKLDGLLVIRRGQRLSVQPVEKQHFDLIRKLGRGSRTRPSASSRKARQ